MLLQEIYRNDPWKLLISCILLNQTSRKQVDKIREYFFQCYPSAHDLNRDERSRSNIPDILKPLGLSLRRSDYIIRMTSIWCAKNYDRRKFELRMGDLRILPGIGKYATDSYRMFVLDDLTVKPTDKELIPALGLMKSSVDPKVNNFL